MKYLKIGIYISFTLICLLLQLSFVLESFTLMDKSQLPLLSGFSAGLAMVAAFLSFPISWLSNLMAHAIPGGFSNLFPITHIASLNSPLNAMFDSLPVLSGLDPRLLLGQYFVPGQLDWPLLLSIPAWNTLERALIRLVEGYEEDERRANHASQAEALSQKFMNPIPPAPIPEPTRDSSVDKSLYSQILNDLKSEVRKLETEVHVDPLTQLYNKGYFQKRLKTEMLNAKSNQGFLSLIMIDLDNFKRLNDTYGHIIGDQALIETARCLRQFAQENRNIVPCRYGGEELALILANNIATAGEQLAERICRQIQGIRLPDAPQVQITASLGVFSVEYKATNGSYDLSPLLMVAKADELMYQAKQAGKNQTMSARLV